MTTTLAIDPGSAIGFTWGEYSITEPWRKTDSAIWSFDQFSEILWNTELIWGDKVIVERFVPQSGAEYTLGEDDLAAVEAIGLIKHVVPLFNEVFWQTRADKWDVPDTLLKKHGLWVTGKDVGHTDGRDANDATIHTLHYMKKINHLPTLREYFR